MDTIFNGQKQRFAYVQGRRVKSLYKGGNKIYQREMMTVTLTNLIPNGSFETNATVWTPSGGSIARSALTPAHGEFGSWMGNLTFNVNGNTFITLNPAIPTVVGRRYYIRSQIRHLNQSYQFGVSYLNNTTALTPAMSIANMVFNQWNLLDGIWTANATSLALRIQFSGGNGNQSRSNVFDNIMVIDLTAAFGAGNEPSLAEIRQIVRDNGGYFTSVDIQI